MTARLDGATLDTYSDDPDETDRRDTVHFGYRDSISRPRFIMTARTSVVADSQPIAPVGSVLLGRVQRGAKAACPASTTAPAFRASHGRCP